MYGKSIEDNYLKLSTSIIYIILHVALYTALTIVLNRYISPSKSRFLCSSWTGLACLVLLFRILTWTRGMGQNMSMNVFQMRYCSSIGNTAELLICRCVALPRLVWAFKVSLVRLFVCLCFCLQLLSGVWNWVYYPVLSLAAGICSVFWIAWLSIFTSLGIASSPVFDMHHYNLIFTKVSL